MVTDIHCRVVDVDLLRQQRDMLLKLLGHTSDSILYGVVSLLDHMLDVAEGYDHP